MRNVSPKERADVNEVIALAEQLVNIRGVSTVRSGLFEKHPFAVFVRRENDATVLLISYVGEEVFRADWGSEMSPGHFSSAPGAWRTEFLATRALDS